MLVEYIRLRFRHRLLDNYRGTVVTQTQRVPMSASDQEPPRRERQEERVILNCETHRNALGRFRAIALASIFVMLPGCTSLSHGSSPVGGPVSAVPAVNASASEVGEAPDPVSDTEVSKAQAALRDASAWGAQYYEAQMYARARALFDAALAAREGDPVRCRSLLAEATEASNSAREAALQAYEKDVKIRFESSRAKLVEIGADKAFPDEFALLVSGIDATAGLFAAGSYRDARYKAYRTLKGMDELYETVRSLLNWLREAQIRVENAIGADQVLDAPRWAPTEMKNAEQKYHDALTQMQAGDLEAAIDSMKAAGQIALRLHFQNNQGTMDKSGASVPLAGRPTLPEHDKEIQGPNPTSQPPSADNPLFGQRVRIADMSMSALGAPQRMYTTFSATVARFDVVAAEGLRDEGIMEKVLAGLGDDWGAAVSRSGYFGFIYNDRVEMVKDLGTYPGKDEFLHTPYAAQFRLAGTRFSVNLVLCHIETNKDRKLEADEIARLAGVYRYFENLTGNRGITLLLAGGLSDVPEQTSESLIRQGEMVSLRTNLTATEGPQDQEQQMFASVALRSRIEESGFGASAPPVAYVILKTSK